MGLRAKGNTLIVLFTDLDVVVLYSHRHTPGLWT